MFDPTGHLTDHALTALASGEDLPELTRLELAEHLAYCDLCLQRYSDVLTAEVLLPPPVSCEKPLLRRIRIRTLSILTSRYATAAAAVALALTLLWSDVSLPVKPDSEPSFVPSFSETVSRWKEDALEDLLNGTQTIFDSLKLPDLRR